MKTISMQARLVSVLFATIASAAVLGGTVAAMTADAQPQSLPLVVMERTVVTSTAH